MQKSGFMFLLIIAAMAALAAYQATVEVPASYAFVRLLGLQAFLLLCVSLAIGPIATLDPSYAQLIEPRRAVGLAAFVLMIGHVLLAVSLEYGWQLQYLLDQLPMLVAIAAAMMMALLALTSCDYAVKTLGNRNWKRVQNMNYIVFALAFFHFVQQSNGLFAKGGQLAPTNLAEAAMVLAGLLVVALQIAGFLARRGRMNKAGTPPSPDSGAGRHKTI